MRNRLPILVMLLASGCTHGRCCRSPAPVSSPTPPISTTTRDYVFFNDGHLGTIITRPENVFGPDAETYDVRDLDRLHGAVEVLLLQLPDLARQQGAEYANLSLGDFRVIGPEKTRAFVAEVLAILRAAPGPHDERVGEVGRSGR